MNETPLHHVHQRLGAAFCERSGWQTPAHYGDPVREYRALCGGAALLDRSPVGRIRALGKDALDLLNRLSTNRFVHLPLGSGAGTVLTTNRGRILDLLWVTARPDHLLYLTSPTRRRRVLDWFDFYTFAEDSALEDMTEATALVGVHGPESAGILRSAGCEVSGLALYASRECQVDGVPVVAVRTDATGRQGYDLVAGAGEADAVFGAVARAGAVPAGIDAYEAARVEQGVPADGAELTEEYNPLEARLRGFISFNKGCYIGQEVVARLNTYRKVQRLLMSLGLDGEARPGEALELEDRRIGVITSVAAVPGEGRIVGLAYVRGVAAVAGRRLRVSGRNVTAELSDPAFALAAEAVAAL